MEKSAVKKIGVLCSGGDSSGMNPCTRAVVRSAIYYKCECMGIWRGYQGMIDNEIRPLGARDVSGIINKGGAMLKSARCDEFRTPDGRAKAIANLKQHGIDGLVVIGGDGSFHGAHYLAQESDIRVVGIPGTIDNDISNTDWTIGYDTAVNVAMDALDKIRDTAASHDRIFFVEVMGRHAGYLAVEAGIAAGAEDILIPETPTDIDKLVERLVTGRKKGKSSSIVVVAEGDEAGGAFDIAKMVSEKVDLKVRVSVLGHMQRGGSPTAFERVLASRMGLHAVRQLIDGKNDIMVGLVRNEMVIGPLEKSWLEKKEVSQEFLDLNDILSI